MKYYKYYIMVPLVYLVTYGIIRITGGVVNLAYFYNNYQTQHSILAVYCWPGAVVENCIMYTSLFGLHGTVKTFKNSTIQVMDPAYMTHRNTIVFWTIDRS